MKKVFYELYQMLNKWYYVIRDPSKMEYGYNGGSIAKMIYSSNLMSKKDAEKYANKRTNLHNVTRKIIVGDT